MSIGIITLIIWGSLLILLLSGLPVAFCLMGVAVMGYFFFMGPATLYVFFANTANLLTTDIYIALPMFIFMATILQFSGLASALYDMMYKWLGGLRGGLAMGTVIICTLLAAMTGLSATGTLSMGMIAYPEMRKRGYEKNMAVGCILAGGTLGPLIPPSILMIVVGALATLSVGKVFIGGIFPGLVMSFLFICYIGIRCFRNPEVGPSLPPEERANWKEKFTSLRGSALPIILIILVLGTIYGGICTPTEAGGIGAFGALVCAAIYRKLNIENLKTAVSTSFRMVAMVFWIMIGGTLFSSLCNSTGVTHFIGGILVGLPFGGIGILIVMMVIVFILGMFIDPIAITLICLPVFLPVVKELGFDVLWFCLLFVMNTIIGFITPPFGANLFYFKGLGYKEITMADVYRAALPFIIPMVITLILCIVFPQILLWLPNTMIK